MKLRVLFFFKKLKWQKLMFSSHSENVKFSASTSTCARLSCQKRLDFGGNNLKAKIQTHKFYFRGHKLEAKR